MLKKVAWSKLGTPAAVSITITAASTANGSKYKEQDVYIKTGKILNPDAPLDQQRYELKPVERRTGTLLPSIGLMIEF